VNAMIATVLVVAVSLWGFLRFVPVGAEARRLRRFNRRTLGYLSLLCTVIFGAIAFRASNLQHAREASEIFVLIFVPQYLTGGFHSMEGARQFQDRVVRGAGGRLGWLHVGGLR